MITDSRLFSRLVDFLVRPIQRPNPVRSSPLGMVLLRARKQIEPVGVLGRRVPHFVKALKSPSTSRPASA